MTKSTVTKKIVSMLYTFSALATFFPSVASASIGAVKVDCNDGCDAVSLGQICDTYRVFSVPTAVACENVGNPGRGGLVSCGAIGTCRPFGDLIRGDLLGSYCFGNGPGNDAVVMCDDSPTARQSEAQAEQEKARDTETED